MKPENFEFGGGSAETIIHPVVLVLMLLTIIAVLFLPRRFILFPFLFTTVLTQGQLYITGVHWFVLRIIILAGLIRLAMAKFGSQEQLVRGGLNSIDKFFIVWALYRATAAMLLFGQIGMVINQAAFLLEAFGGYFLLRYLIQDEDDIAQAAKSFAVLTVICGLCMLNEKLNDINIFGFIHSGPLIPQMRDGQIRAQAAFRHPILAGCFGATLVPLFFWLWRSGRAKVLAAAGIVGSTLMVLMANSSTPVLASAAGVGALFLWPIRDYMRAVRWAIIAALIVLALLMKAPVWFIVAHMNVIGGSGGYDRAYLIDVCIRHFWDWWLIGTNDIGSWGVDMWDLSNQFVAEAEAGGLVTFVCFIGIVSRGFGRLGTLRKILAGDRDREWLLWCLGAVMLANVFAYFGVSYWDQTRIWWWSFLAMVSAATVALESPAVEEVTISEEVPDDAKLCMG